MGFSFGVSEWHYLPDDMLAQLQREVDRQEEEGQPWVLLSGAPIDWPTVLAHEPQPPVLSWSMPYSAGADGLAGAFNTVYDGLGRHLRAGRYITFVPFRKVDIRRDDNNDVHTTYHGRDWFIITLADMTMWTDNAVGRHAARLRAGEEFFAAHPHADFEQIPDEWFVGAVLAMAGQAARDTVPIKVWWP